MYFYCCAVILSSCKCRQTAEFTCTSTGAVCYLHDNINCACELMGTQVEKYRSRKIRMHCYMYNGDGFLLCLGKENYFSSLIDFLLSLIDWIVDWIKDLNISAEMLLKQKIPSLTLHTQEQYEWQSKRQSCPTELSSQPS